VLALERPVADAELYARAAAGAMAATDLALERAGLAAGPGRAGYAVDAAARDLARFFYAPRATVAREERQATVRLVREQPFSAEGLAAISKPAPPTPPPRPAGALSREYREAVRRWNDDHTQDWGAPGHGECPACGHRGCFGRLPERPEKWTCFSTGPEGHGARTKGRCGREGKAGHWFGDALDLEAYRRGATRRQVLIDERYLASRSRLSRSRSSVEPRA
jgi:hypothetical protein